MSDPVQIALGFPTLIAGDVTPGVEFSVVASTAALAGDVVPGETEPVFGKTHAIDRTGFYGRGSLTGTVKNLGSPNQPVRRRVQLIHEKTGFVIRETLSDAVTGEYTFSEISPQGTYSVVAYDHTGTFRAVVADNLTATP